MSKYVNEVLKFIKTDRSTKKRIKEDLMNRIEEALDEDPYFNPYDQIGQPMDVAKDFLENMDTVYPDLTTKIFFKESYEYRSRFKLFGVPLVHINTGNGAVTKTARGIIAIGDIATGVVSIGGVSVGLISVGGVSLGVLTLGGVAIGVGAIGGVAIGFYALGGVAIALYEAFGAVSNLQIFRRM